MGAMSFVNVGALVDCACIDCGYETKTTATNANGAMLRRIALFHLGFAMTAPSDCLRDLIWVVIICTRTGPESNKWKRVSRCDKVLHSQRFTNRRMGRQLRLAKRCDLALQRSLQVRAFGLREREILVRGLLEFR